MEKKHLKPAEITDYTIAVAQERAGGSFQKLFILGILAGAFIGFAAESSNMTAVLAGGELFTGNTLMLAVILDQKKSVSKMLRNWLIVYAGNFLGSLLIAYRMANSRLFASGAGMLGTVTRYYIPAGILAKSNETFAQLSGLSQEALNSLTYKKA